MRSRNRSCTSHAKKAVLEGKSFPRRRGAEAAIVQSPTPARAGGENCGGIIHLPLLTTFPAGILREVGVRWLTKNPCALTAESNSSANRIQTSLFPLNSQPKHENTAHTAKDANLCIAYLPS